MNVLLKEKKDLIFAHINKKDDNKIDMYKVK
jgi:hypothetical protein